MAAFKPVPAELAHSFEASLPDDELVQRRKMFGCPCAFVNGNMFAGLHEDRMVLRLSPEEREQSLKERRAQPCEIMGRTMREYVLLPDPMDRKASEVAHWIARSFAYARELPPKLPKAKKSSVTRKASGKPKASLRGA